MRNRTIENLLATMPVFAKALPGIKFFEPMPEFFDWMADTYKGMELFDVGAGIGHIAAGLQRSGLKVQALDIIKREGAVFPVINVNAVRYNYPASSVLMFCRPCHNGFVEATIQRGIDCGVRYFVYVSLPKNSVNDLGRFRRKFSLACKKIGASGESMYAMG
jgi:hypothetical protein